FAAKKLHVLISAVFALADAAKAHEMMESAAHIGKIVLKVR
ncbi:MAG: zinc-binding dehydrogenase, partial [Smithella sp.]